MLLHFILSRLSVLVYSSSRIHLNSNSFWFLNQIKKIGKRISIFQTLLGLFPWPATLPSGMHCAAKANRTMGRAQDVTAPDYSFKSKLNQGFFSPFQIWARILTNNADSRSNLGIDLAVESLCFTPYFSLIKTPLVTLFLAPKPPPFSSQAHHWCHIKPQPPELCCQA
jgi:hypothetical protein